MKKLLITGATGFLGRHALMAAINKGYDVFAITIDDVDPSEKEVKWIQLDIFDYQQVRHIVSEIRPSHVLHLAWYAVPGKYWTSVENLKWVQASLELLMAFQQYGGKRAVFAGSCAEYDWKYGFCSELLTPLNPETLYGACKGSLQQIVSRFSIQTGLSSAWGRIFFLYGPHEHPSRLVPSVILSLLAGKDALCSHGEQIRDFMHVQDVADAFVALLDSDIQGPVNIASGKPIRIRDIVMIIASKLHAEDRIKFGSISSPVGEPPLLLANVRRLNKDVGWEPTLDLEHGIALTIDSWAKETST